MDESELPEQRILVFFSSNCSEVKEQLITLINLVLTQIVITIAFSILRYFTV